MPIELTAYELGLLPVALSYAKKLEEAGETLTRDGLRRELSCGKDIASRLRQFIKDSKGVKLAAHLKSLPERAEDRNVVEYALGDTESPYGFMLRENLRLKRALDNRKQKTKAEKEQRAQEIRAEIEELKALAKEDLASVKKSGKIKEAPETGLLLEVSPYDCHFGKLCYPKEVNDVPYDLEIAEAVYNRAI